MVMHNVESVLEIETYKLLGDLEMQTDHPISTRRPDLIIIKKKKRIWRIVDLAVSVNHRVKLKECEKRDKYVDLAKKLKKLWNMEVVIIPIVIGALSTITKGLVQGLGNYRTSRDRPNYCITEIGQNTEKNPGDLRRLVVTQTPVRTH